MKYPKEFNQEPLKEQPGKESEMSIKPIIVRDNYRGSGKLKNKSALITGGDSGIGKSCAIHFAKEGANVAIIYFDESKDAKDTQKEIEAEGVKCLLLKGDLKDKEFCKEAVEKTVDTFGQLNVVVNNAAVQFQEEGLEDIKYENLYETYETNVYPLFYITKAAMPHLKEGDCIINTTSITAYRGNPTLIDYSSSKGAILSFTRALAGSLADKGIRVNAVAPGPIWTALIPATLKDYKEFGQDTPIGRAGQPAELGPAYVFLASEDSSYVTGQTIHVNGGSIIGG
ncbi:SDR family oxidoreductase [Galbibacter sp. BG1]|uniref:SDR family oxidoreductase n=1 Tax=Galbibacter sp. BG1 TaxID=1170699 RepID=UPI0015B8A61D|nr:SDR family oxidoreductase [Galbibacter sp. BG1]QLE02847.1 SDR family oxidoreductase [Galbibacter sp. BG1]